MRVLAVDPALRSTGYAVVESASKGERSISYGLVKNPQSHLPSRCYLAVNERLKDVIREFKPDCCALESIIYVQSVRTAIAMGGVRSAVLIAAAEAGLEIFEYPPRRVKQAIVGRGSADKQQVAFMVRSLLSLTETPSPDEADALAIGLTHIYTANRPDAGKGDSSQT